MPKTAKSTKTSESKVIKVEEVVQVPEREIVYETLTIAEYSTAGEHEALTAADMKELMGWETEKEYQKRKVEEVPGTKEEHWLYGDDFHCWSVPDSVQKNLGIKKEKVRCWHNRGNRPFDSAGVRWAEEIMDMILHGQWAGPLTIPGETVNGETIRFSKYGDMLSGQHQGTGLIWADTALKAQQKKEAMRAVELGSTVVTNPKYPFWQDKEGPVIETIVVTGLSSDERVLRTIDYVKPRTVGDMLYTMPLFRENDMNERREMTRMLAAAINTLWHRTDTKGYMTHPEVVGFLERHNTLLECVEHLFVEDNGVTKNDRMSRLEGEEDAEYTARMEVVKKEGARRISKLKVQPGMAAALMYLMATSGTPHESADKPTADCYRNMMPPNEEVLDWSLWERARDFWSRFAGHHTFLPVRMAIGRLIDSSANDDDNQGLGGRIDERLAIICKAWNVFKDHPESSGPPFPFEITEDGRIVCDDLKDGGALSLSYTDLDANSKPLPDGEIELLDDIDFQGIDCKMTKKKRTATAAKEEPMPPPPSEKQIWGEGTVKAQEDREAKKGSKRKAEPTPSKLDELAAQAQRNIGNVKVPVKPRTVVRKK